MFPVVELSVLECNVTNPLVIEIHGICKTHTHGPLS